MMQPETFFHNLPDKAQLRYSMTNVGNAARGTVLIAPGRREFIEKKRAELGRELTQQGFNQIYFEWRGQGLSSRYFSGDKRQRDHAVDFNQHLDDLRSFYKAIIKPDLKMPLLIHGHSLGAHLLLRWLAEDKPAEVTKAFLTAPMLAIGPRFAHHVSRPVCWAAIKAGKSEEYAPMQHDYDDSDRAFTLNPLTHDETRFRIIQDYFDASPDLRVGGVTWGWLAAAIRSMQTCRSAGYLSRINIPVQVLIGDKDIVTPAAELLRYLPHIPKIETIILHDAKHDVLNERDTPRAEAWRHIYRFMG